MRNRDSGTFRPTRCSAPRSPTWATCKPKTPSSSRSRTTWAKSSSRTFYGSLKLNVCEYTFEGHDEVVAYSLSVPFASTLVFASIMKHQDAPGTTFKKHMAIARGLLSEDDYLLTEILFNPKTPAQIDNIVATLTRLSKIIDKKDSGEMKRFLDAVRKNLE